MMWFTMNDSQQTKMDGKRKRRERHPREENPSHVQDSVVLSLISLSFCLNNTHRDGVSDMP